MAPGTTRGTVLGAQPPSAPQTVDGAYLEKIPVDAVLPNPRQPRQHFDEDALAELTASITEVGLLQPVVVRRVNRSVSGAARYELIMGEVHLSMGQYRAHQSARPTTIVQEHNDILEAIAAGDADTAQRHMALHLRNAKERLLSRADGVGTGDDSTP